MRFDQIENQVLRRMRQGPRRVRLNRNSWLLHEIGPAKPAGDFALIIAAGHDLKKPSLRLENVGGGGETTLSKQGRRYTVLSRAAGVKRLGHGAEVLAQSGGHAGTDTE